MPEDENPVTEAVRDAVHEGESEATPFVAWTGVAIVVGVAVGLLTAAALVIYFVIGP